MELFGIGPLELIFILLIALIILGPKDMVKAGLTLGRLLRKVITSPEWRTIQKASREMRNLPNRLMREASLEDLSKEMNDINKIGGQLNTDLKKIDQDLSSWTTPPDPKEIQSNQIEPDAPNIQVVDSPSKPDSVNDDSS